MHSEYRKIFRLLTLLLRAIAPTLLLVSSIGWLWEGSFAVIPVYDFAVWEGGAEGLDLLCGDVVVAEV